MGRDLGLARRLANLSRREVGRRIGVGHELVKLIEDGDPRAMTLDRVAPFAEVVGLRLAASLYPNADPVRDEAQLRLLERFRSRLHPSLSWRTEVPMPIPGDRRGADAVIGGTVFDAMVEAESRLGDLQLVERKLEGKRRDLAPDRVILLVADTPHNRRVLRDHPEFRERFPVDTRTCLARLSRGEDPGGDCLVIL